jgi:hypothetical protein
VPEREEADFLHLGNLLLSGLVCDRRCAVPSSGWEHVANFSPLMCFRFSMGNARGHPLVLGEMVKRGAQPGAGTFLADLDNSRCTSRIRCYGISEYPFIASDNFYERFSSDRR